MQREIASLAAACGLGIFPYHAFPSLVIEAASPVLGAHRPVSADAVMPAMTEPPMAPPTATADSTDSCALPEPRRPNATVAAMPRPAVPPASFLLAPPSTTVQPVPASTPRQRRSFAMLHEVRDTMDTTRHPTRPASERSDR